MRLHQRSISKVTLVNVLKRRKTNLKNFLSETGIVTYELLKTRCDSMGVIPPDEVEFLEATGTDATKPAAISSPAEGLIVLDPPKILNELTGKESELTTHFASENTEPSDVTEQVIFDDSSSKKKKKK